MAITDNGQAYSWGSKIGLGGPEAVGTAVGSPRLLAVDGVAAVAAGDRHALLLLDNGEVYGFGDDDVGQLGGVVSTRVSSTDKTGILSVPKAKAIAALRKYVPAAPTGKYLATHQRPP